MNPDTALSSRRQVGIDLGTSNSSLAYLDRTGTPVSVSNFEGDVLTPSKVLIDEQLAIVGREAARAAQANCQQYAEHIKRFMGQDFFPHPLSGQYWRPEVLSALLLKRLRRDAERRLGNIEAAVITVPAYFDECRRRATVHAAHIAGLQLLDLINEPTAAAIAFAHRQDQLKPTAGSRHFLVFDLGGGTLDVTIVRVEGGIEFRTLATDGDVQLGGLDWDLRLCQHLGEQFHSATGHDPLATPRGQLAMSQLAESAKRQLTMRPAVVVPSLVQGHRAKLAVNRELFETITADLLERARSTTNRVLEQTSLRWSDIDHLLLVGGAAHMPMIGRMLHELTGLKPDQSLSADEAVAHGAAIYASLKDDNQLRVVNVNSYTYRVVAARRNQPKAAVPLIKKNSPLPAEGKYQFKLGNPGQRSCGIRVCQGESMDPESCAEVGHVAISGWPEHLTKQWLVSVTLLCQKDGNLSVSANIHDPDQPASIVHQAAVELVPRFGMSKIDVQIACNLVASLEIS